MGRNRRCQLREVNNAISKLSKDRQASETGASLCSNASTRRDNAPWNSVHLMSAPWKQETKTKKASLIFPSSLPRCFRRKKPKAVLEKPGAWLATRAWPGRTVSNVFRINTSCSSNLDEGPWRKWLGMNRTKSRRDGSSRGK